MSGPPPQREAQTDRSWEWLIGWRWASLSYVAPQSLWSKEIQNTKITKLKFMGRRGGDKASVPPLVILPRTADSRVGAPGSSCFHRRSTTRDIYEQGAHDPQTERSPKQPNTGNKKYSCRLTLLVRLFEQIFDPSKWDCEQIFDPGKQDCEQPARRDALGQFRCTNKIFPAKMVNAYFHLMTTGKRITKKHPTHLIWQWEGVTNWDSL